MNRIKTAIETGRQSLVELDRETVDRLFTITLLLFATVMLLLTFTYGEKTRLLPLIVLVPTWTLLLALLIFQIFPSVANRVKLTDEGGLGGFGDVIEQDPEEETENGELTAVERHRRLIQVLGWLGGGFVIVLILGFVDGFLVYLLAFYYFWADQTIQKSILYSMIVWGFFVFLFRLVLGIPFTRGYVNIISTFI